MEQVAQTVHSNSLRMHRKLVTGYQLFLAICLILLLFSAVGLLSFWVALLAAGVLWVVVSVATLFRKRPLRLTDWAVLALLLFEAATYRLSVYPANSQVLVTLLAISAAAYLAFAELRSKIVFTLFFDAVCLICLIDALADVTHFLAMYIDWKALSFGALADVKVALTTVGVAPGGEHFTIYLCFLPWLVMMVTGNRTSPKFLKVIGGVALSAAFLAILLSLSRGIWVATAAFLAMLLLGSGIGLGPVNRKQITTYLLLSLMLPLAAFLLLRKDLASDLLLFATTSNSSKTRSVQGRVNTWRHSLEHFNEHPAMGFGANTFALYGSLGQTEDGGGYVGHAFSLPMQILFERGLVGAAVYGTFFLLVLASAVNSVRWRRQYAGADWLGWIALTGVASLLIRDLTYSTLLFDPAVTISTFGLIGVAARGQRRYRIRARWRSVKLAPVAPGIAAALAIFFLFLGYRRLQVDELMRLVLRADERSNEGRASWLSGRVEHLLPSPFLKAQNGLLLARSANLRVDLDGTLQGEPLTPQATNLVQKARRAFEESVREFPADAAWLHNYGWLRWYASDQNAAVQSLEKAVALEPETAAYRQSLTLMLLASGQKQAAWQQIGRLLTDSPEVLNSRWWQNIKFSDGEEATSAVRNALASLSVEGDQDPIRLARKARLCMELSDYDSASRLLRSALKQLPGLAGAWTNYALVLVHTGNRSEAVRCLARAIFLQPMNYRARYALSVLEQDSSSSNGERSLDEQARYAARMQRSPEAERVYRKFLIHPNLRQDMVIADLYPYLSPDFADATAWSNR